MTRWGRLEGRKSVQEDMVLIKSAEKGESAEVREQYGGGLVRTFV